jgi:hypothetical protein
VTAPHAIACPNCGGTVEVRAAGWSTTLACNHCGSILDVSRPEVAVITAYKTAAHSLAIEPGVRGVLFDDEWEVVGALRRKDRVCAWQEFLLFNPYLGYRWLVCFEGDWQFGTPLLDFPETDSAMATWRGERFTRSGEPAEAETTTVIGEFYWRVARGDRATASSYERGDVVLSREDSDGEINWTQLVPVDADMVEAAFAVNTRKLPRSPASTSLGFTASHAQERDDLPAMLLVAVGTLFAALVLMIVLAGPTNRTGGNFNVPVGGARNEVKVGTITVERPWQFITVRGDVTSPGFDNRWVDLDFSLVDTRTQQSLDGSGTIERYSGTDSDGPWTEGGTAEETLFGHVPRGTYDIYVDASAHGWPSDPSPDIWNQAEQVSVNVAAETGSYPWGNFWTLLFSIAVLPIAVIWWRRSQEDDD